MHPETKKVTQKNMPYLTLTLTENLKLQLSPGLVASYNIQPGNGEGLFWDKHTHVYLLTYLLRTHTGPLGHQAFSVARPTVWNTLQDKLEAVPTKPFDNC